MDSIKKIAFDTSKQVNFDLLRLEEILRRTDIDHDPRKLHRVDFYILIIVLSGHHKHMVDFTEHPLERGSILAIRRNQIHQFFDGEWTGKMMIFTDDFLAQHLEELEALKILQLFNGVLGSPKLQLSPTEIDDLEELIEHISQEFEHVRDDYSPGIIRSLFIVLISKLFRHKSQHQLVEKKEKYLAAFIQFQQLVEQQCFESKKVQDYAKQMLITTKTLNNIVKSVIHKTAKTFIDEMVILRIKRLLIHSSLTVNEIAYQAGFDDPTNLYKYFKRFNELTPEAFRKKHQ